MGGLSIAFFLALLGTPAVIIPGEIVLITGRVRVAQDQPRAAARIDSRKFEVVLRRRNGATVGAEACLYSDLMDDQDWDGGCFPLTLLPGDESIAHLATSSPEMAPVDAPAQRLLRMLASDTEKQRFPARRIVGFDPDAPITFHVERFSEADL